MCRWELVISIVSLSLATSCGTGDTSPKDGAGDNDDDIVKINNESTNNAENSSTNGTNGTPDPMSISGQIKSGIVAPQVAHDAGVGALDLLAEAVFLASELGAGGQALVTTGTLTQQGQEASFTYETSPSERLIIAWSEGAATEFEVTRFDGDFTGNAGRFVYSDHDVAFSIHVDGKTDLQISSVRSGGASEASMVGTVTLDDGVTYSVDLALAGTYSYAVNNSVEHESEETFTGTITSDGGFSANVNEWYRFKLVGVDNLVTNEERTAETTWSAGGSTYSLQNHHIRYETLNGWANPSDYWIVQGDIFQGEQQIGQVAIEENELWIEIYAEVDGEKIELQTFQKKQ